MSCARYFPTTNEYEEINAAMPLEVLLIIEHENIYFFSLIEPLLASVTNMVFHSSPPPPIASAGDPISGEILFSYMMRF